MRRARALEWGCAVLLAATLSGCRDAPPASSGDQPTALSTTPPPATGPQTSRGVFEEWRRQAISADSGRFTVSFPAGGYSVHDEGTYQLDPQISAFTRSTVNATRQPGTLRIFANRRNTWLKAETGPTEYGPCWAADPDSLASMYGVNLGEAAGAQHPAVTALGAAEIKGYTTQFKDELDATANLYTSISVMGTAVTTELGIPPSTHARVPIHIQLSGNEVTGWSTSLPALFTAAKKAGFHSDLLKPNDFFGSAILVTIKADGAPFEQKQPRPEHVVELVPNPAVFAAALKDCVRR